MLDLLKRLEMDRVVAGVAFTLGMFAVLIASVAFGQTSASVPLASVVVARNCEERTIQWIQPAGQPDAYSVEWLQVFNTGAAVTYDTPLRFTVPGSVTTWKGKVPRSGLFMVRVRAEYRDGGAPTSTAWSESTNAQITLSGAFLVNLSICPPGGFEPN